MYDMKKTCQTLELVGKRKLVVERSRMKDVLRIVRFEGSGLMIQAAGALAIDAERVAIHGREGLALTTNGDAQIRVAGELRTQARAQYLTAELGNVAIRANDDVKLDGERIRMNC